MQGLLAISRAIDTLNAAMAGTARWMVLVCCLISAGNAVSRYAMSLSSNAWLEIQWYLFGVVVMLGAAHTLNQNGHVRVDVVYANVSTRTRLWIDLIGMVLFLMPAAILVGWVSWPLFYNSFLIQEMSSNAGGLIRWPAKLLLPLGFALLALQGLSEVVKRIGALRGDVDLVARYERPLQ